MRSVETYIEKGSIDYVKVKYISNNIKNWKTMLKRYLYDKVKFVYVLL